MTHQEILEKLGTILKRVEIHVQKTTRTTGNYRATLILSVHRAFDTFADGLELEPTQRCKLLNVLKEHAIEKETDRSNVPFSVLFYQIPNEFNVRGEWTSEKVRITQTNTEAICLNCHSPLWIGSC